MHKGTGLEELVQSIRTVHSGQVSVSPQTATTLVGAYVRSLRGEAGEDAYDSLSTREREVLPMLAEGRTTSDVATELHLSPYTVQTYRQRIMRKLELHSATELVKYALRRGIIHLDP